MALLPGGGGVYPAEIPHGNRNGKGDEVSLTKEFSFVLEYGMCLRIGDMRVRI